MVLLLLSRKAWHHTKEIVYMYEMIQETTGWPQSCGGNQSNGANGVGANVAFQKNTVQTDWGLCTDPWGSMLILYRQLYHEFFCRPLSRSIKPSIHLFKCTGWLSDVQLSGNLCRLSDLEPLKGQECMNGAIKTDSLYLNRSLPSVLPCRAQQERVSL